MKTETYIDVGALLFSNCGKSENVTDDAVIAEVSGGQRPSRLGGLEQLWRNANWAQKA